jgi:uncharacterized protein YeaC (DUF1315 family)
MVNAGLTHPTDVNIILQLPSKNVSPDVIQLLTKLNKMGHIKKIMIINNMDNSSILEKGKNTPELQNKGFTDFNFKIDEPLNLDIEIFKNDNTTDNNLIICELSKKKELMNKLNATFKGNTAYSLENAACITYKSEGLDAVISTKLFIILYALLTNFVPYKTKDNAINEKTSKILYGMEKLFGVLLKPDLSGKTGLDKEEQKMMLRIVDNIQKDKSMQLVNMYDINTAEDSNQMQTAGGFLAKIKNIRHKFKRNKRQTKKSNIVEKVDHVKSKKVKKATKKNLEQLVIEDKGKLIAQKNYATQFLLMKDIPSPNPYAKYKVNDFDIVMSFKNLRGLEILDFILYTVVGKPGDGVKLTKSFKDNYKKQKAKIAQQANNNNEINMKRLQHYKNDFEKHKGQLHPVQPVQAVQPTPPVQPVQPTPPVQPVQPVQQKPKQKPKKTTLQTPQTLHTLKIQPKKPKTHFKRGNYTLIGNRNKMTHKRMKSKNNGKKTKKVGFFKRLKNKLRRKKKNN